MSNNMKRMSVFPYAKHKSDIKYHFYVVSYFLSKYLEKYFYIDRIHTLGKGIKSENLLKNGIRNDETEYQKDKFSAKSREFASFCSINNEYFKNVDFLLSTSQRGFTKLRDREENAFKKIKQIKKNNPKLKLVSIQDHSGLRNYYEDILLVSIPFSDSHKKILLDSTGTDAVYIGWCADHNILKDCGKKNGDLNIVLDHSALQSFRMDATSLYLRQLRALKKKHPNKDINLCRINKGFEFYDFKNNSWTFDLSNRWWSSKYDGGFSNGDGCSIFQIAECLNNSHIFCVTHVESCGLTAIESLMAGCKLYNPSGKDRYNVWKGRGKKPGMAEYAGPFIKKSLLSDYMDYDIFDIKNEKKLFKMMERDLTSYKNHTNRIKLIENHSWQSAAKRVYEGLVQKNDK